ERFLLAIFVGVGVLWRGWLLMGPTEAGGLCGCFGKLHLSRAGFELPPCATTCFSARAGSNDVGGLCGCFGKLHLSRAGFELPPCATTCFSARAGVFQDKALILLAFTVADNGCRQVLVKRLVCAPVCSNC